LLAFYVWFAAPAIVDSVFDDAMAFLLSQGAIAGVQVLLLVVFIWFLFFPVSLSLKDVETNQLQIFLSAPVKPSDLLLGEFVGVMPFYGIAIALLAGFFTALLIPIGIGVVQTAIIILVFILVFFSALWIGTVVAGVLRAKLGGSERGRDIGKAMGFLLALPVVGIMYAVMGGALETITESGAVGALEFLSIFPSSWGASLIVEFAANPGSIGAVWMETFMNLGGLVIFLLASLWLGTELAKRTYTLETAGFGFSKAGSDGIAYRTLRSAMGGGPFATIIVSFMKDYGRRLQNISRLGYIIGIMVLINVFLVRPDEPFGILIISQALFGLLAVFVVGEVTVRGKPALFIYRKAPRGIKRLIGARLIHGWMITVTTAVILLAIQLMLLPEIELLPFLGYLGFAFAVSAGFVVTALGFFLVMPAFSDKSGEFMIATIGVAMIASMAFVALVIALGEFWAMVAHLCLIWSLGGILLLIGASRIRQLE